MWIMQPQKMQIFYSSFMKSVEETVINFAGNYADIPK